MIRFTYRTMRFIVPKGILMNRIACSDFVQGIHRLATPEVIVALDGMMDAAKRAQEIASSQPVNTFWLAGNDIEQERFLSQYHPDNLIRFSASSNTKDQAVKIVNRAKECKITCIGILDYEFHVVRTLLTLVCQAQKCGVLVRFIPYAYVDFNRGPMLPELRELGVLIEAIKLWRYQASGDIAKLQDALDYYGL